MKHSYAALRCKMCLSREITTWILLKYFGPQDGTTFYTLQFPPPPLMLAFSMPCWTCGTTETYSRNDIQGYTTDEAPNSDFVDQIPLTSILKSDGGII